MHAAITLDNVSKRHAENSLALDGVSLSVPTGEFLAVVGSSGSGKTTLLQLINRLTEPTLGVVRIDGNDIAGIEPASLRRQIGYVFQEAGLFPHMTAAENIAITPKLLGWEPARIAARVTETLELVRLNPDYAPRFGAQLSGGEQQRVGVARALAAQPRIVLMDEPFSALDPLVRAEIGQDYRQLHDQMGLTTVLVTHDVLEALVLADRIAVLRAGKLVAIASPADMVASRDGYVRDLMQAPRKLAARVEAALAHKG